MALAVSGCSQLQQLAGSPAERLAEDVVIERDAWGVPHVHGRSDAAALFGLAFAMAEDDHAGIEADMLHALGRAAHYYGESRLGHDVVRGAYDVEARARAEYGREPAERRVLWDAFAHGLNHYLQTHPAAPRRLLLRYEPWMLFARAAAFDAATLADSVPLGRVAGRGTALASAAAPSAAVRSWGWAIAPEHSATGEPLLLAALAAPWYGWGRLYEATLHSDAGWQVAGAFELGLPLPRAGHNQRLAWLEAAAATPHARLLTLVFDHPSDSLLFRTDGEWQRAASRELRLRVNSATGVVEQAVRFIDTPLGAIVVRRGDTAYAAQLAAGVQDGALQRALAMSHATSLEAFRSARGAAASERWNTLYADVDGRTAAWIDGAEAGSGAGMLRLGPAPQAERLAPDGGWTIAALEHAAFDAFVPDAGDEVRALVDEWERVGGTNPRRAAVLDSAITVLREWDQRFTAASAAAPLYATWLEAYARGDTAGAYGRFRALETAVARHAREPVRSRTWGDVLRLQRRRDGEAAFVDSLPSLPLGAAPAGTGAGFAVAALPAGDGRRYAAGGRAWTAVVRLGQPPESRSVAPFGPGASTGPADFRDSAEQFAAGALKALQSGPAPAPAEVRERYRPGRRARVLQQ